MLLNFERKKMIKRELTKIRINGLELMQRSKSMGQKLWVRSYGSNPMGLTFWVRSQRTKCTLMSGISTYLPAVKK